MKKFIIPVFSVLCLISCGNQTAKVVALTDSDSTNIEQIADKAGKNKNKEAAKAVVEAAYTKYFRSIDEDVQVEEHEEALSIFGMNYMYSFISLKLQEKIVEAYDKQIETDELFFDFDVWINAQDFGELTLKDVNIIEYSGEKATAEVNFTNFGTDDKAYVVVEYDKKNDTWFICDFLDPEDKSSYAESIDSYLSDENESE